MWYLIGLVLVLVVISISIWYNEKRNSYTKEIDISYKLENGNISEIYKAECVWYNTERDELEVFPCYEIPSNPNIIFIGDL